MAILLSRQANSPSFTGLHRVLLPDGPSYLDFRYSVLRVWTMDVEMVLKSGPGTLPLAPLAKVSQRELPAVIDRMKRRFEREVPENEANLLWTATKILMGMKYTEELVETLLRGVQGMKESVTYQAIIEEGVVKGLVKGRIEGERLILLQMGRKRLGEPSPAVIKRLEEIVDEATLSVLADRMFDVSTWDELLDAR